MRCHLSERRVDFGSNSLEGGKKIKMCLYLPLKGLSCVNVEVNSAVIAMASVLEAFPAVPTQKEGNWTQINLF